MLVQKSTISALKMLCCTKEYYSSTGEAILVRQGTIGALENLKGSVCTAEYYRSTREAVLVSHSGGCAGIAEN